jgi:C-terminal processing protease CtpA/Prc
MTKETTGGKWLLTASAIALLLFAGPNLATAQQDRDDRGANDSYESNQSQQDYDADDQDQTRRENRIERRQDRFWRDDETPRQNDQNRTSESDREPAIGVAVEADRREGVRILRVFRDTPAEEAGLRVGDQIIEVSGRQVNTPRGLIATIQDRRVGQRVDLVVLREGRVRTVPVRLESRQEALQDDQYDTRQQQNTRQDERMALSEEYGQRSYRSGRDSSQYYDDPTPGRAGDDLSAHIDSLEDEIRRLRNEIAELRQMVASRPQQDSGRR